jgi:putative tricarboxylic transport membrane protein
MRFNDILIGSVFLALAIGIILVAAGFHTPPGQRFGPGFFPTIVAAVMAAASIGLILRGVASGRRPWVVWEDWVTRPGGLLRGGSVFAFLLLYLMLAETLGFLIVAPLLLWALIWVLWGRPVAALAIAVTAGFAIHQFFVQLLLVPLPWGLVPYFKLF